MLRLAQRAQQAQRAPVDAVHHALQVQDVLCQRFQLGAGGCQLGVGLQQKQWQHEESLFYVAAQQTFFAVSLDISLTLSPAVRPRHTAAALPSARTPNCADSARGKQSVRCTQCCAAVVLPLPLLTAPAQVLPSLSRP